MTSSPKSAEICENLPEILGHCIVFGTVESTVNSAGMNASCAKTQKHSLSRGQSHDIVAPFSYGWIDLGQDRKL